MSDWSKRHANKWTETVLKYLSACPRAPGWHTTDLVNEAEKKLRPVNGRVVDLRTSEMWCDVPSGTTPEQYTSTVLRLMESDLRLSTKINALGKKIFTVSDGAVAAPASTVTQVRSYSSNNGSEPDWVRAHAEHWASVATRFVSQNIAGASKRYFVGDIVNNAGKALEKTPRPAGYADVPLATTIHTYIPLILAEIRRSSALDCSEDERGRQFLFKKRGAPQAPAAVPLAHFTPPTAAAHAQLALATGPLAPGTPAAPGSYAAIAAHAQPHEEARRAATASMLDTLFGTSAAAYRASTSTTSATPKVVHVPAWVKAHADHWTGVALRFVDGTNDLTRRAAVTRYYTGDMLNNVGRSLESAPRNASYSDVPSGVSLSEYMKRVLGHMIAHPELEYGEDEKGRQYFARKRPGSISIVARPTQAVASSTAATVGGAASDGDGGARSSSTGAGSQPHAAHVEASEPIDAQLSIDATQPDWIGTHAAFWAETALGHMESHPSEAGWPIAALFQAANTALGAAIDSPDVRLARFMDVPASVSAQEYFSAMVGQLQQDPFALALSISENSVPFFTKKAAAAQDDAIAISTMVNASSAHLMGDEPIESGGGGGDLSSVLWTPPSSEEQRAHTNVHAAHAAGSTAAQGGSGLGQSLSQEELSAADVAMSVALSAFDPSSPTMMAGGRNAPSYTGHTTQQTAGMGTGAGAAQGSKLARMLGNTGGPMFNPHMVGASSGLGLGLGLGEDMGVPIGTGMGMGLAAQAHGPVPQPSFAALHAEAFSARALAQAQAARAFTLALTALEGSQNALDSAAAQRALEAARRALELVSFSTT